MVGLLFVKKQMRLFFTFLDQRPKGRCYKDTWLCFLHHSIVNFIYFEQRVIFLFLLNKKIIMKLLRSFWSSIFLFFYNNGSPNGLLIEYQFREMTAAVLLLLKMKCSRY